MTTSIAELDDLYERVLTQRSNLPKDMAAEYRDAAAEIFARFKKWLADNRIDPLAMTYEQVGAWRALQLDSRSVVYDILQLAVDDGLLQLHPYRIAGPPRPRAPQKPSVNGSVEISVSAEDGDVSFTVYAGAVRAESDTLDGALRAFETRVRQIVE